MSGLQADFTAGRWTGKKLCRIEPGIRVEGAAHACHGIQIRFAEKQTNVGFFFQSDAVLTGDAAAKFDAGAQGGSARFDDAIDFAGRAHVEQNIRVQIAVAGMEHIGDAQIELFADLGDAPHHLR